MTSTQSTHQTPSTRDLDRRAHGVRRRLLAGALGLGLAGVAFGLSSSPGRIGGSTPRAEVAIPGVRGTGGGASSLYGISTSPGSMRLSLRKAGGHDPIFFG